MLSFLTAPILKYVSGGLAVALLLLGAHDARVNHLRATYKAQRDEARQLYAKLKTDIVDQTKAAEAAQIAAVKAKEAEYVAKAQTADANYTNLRSRYNAAVLRAKTAQRATSPTSPSGESGSAGVPEKAASDAQLCISDADAAKVGDLAAYAEAAHAWALTLQ